MAEPENAATQMGATEQLLLLQKAAYEIKPDLNTPLEKSREILRDMLIKDGYDLERNNLDAATRAWQHRNGLSPKGLDEDGRPDAVTVATLASKSTLLNNINVPTDKLHEVALSLLTSTAKLGSPLAQTFVHAGLINPPHPPIIPDNAPPSISQEQGVSDPPIGEKLSDGAVTLREAGSNAIDGIKNLGNRVWNGATDAFDALGKKIDEAQTPEATAARKAQLAETQQAIGERATQLREGAGELAGKAGDALSGALDYLKGGLEKLTSDDKPATETPAAEPGNKPAAAKPPRQEVKF